MAPLDESSEVGQTPFEVAKQAEAVALQKENAKRSQLLTQITSEALKFFQKAGLRDENPEEPSDGKFKRGENEYQISNYKAETPTKIIIFNDVEGNETPALLEHGFRPEEPSRQKGVNFAILPDGSIYETELHSNMGEPNTLNISRVSLPTPDGHRYPLWQEALSVDQPESSNFVSIFSLPGEGKPGFKIVRINEQTDIATLEHVDNLMHSALHKDQVR